MTVLVLPPVKKKRFRPYKIKILRDCPLTPMTQQNLLRGADVDISFYFFIGHVYNSFNSSYLIKNKKKTQKI